MKNNADIKSSVCPVKKWFAYIYFFASLGICLYVLTVSITARQSRQWPATSGEVLSSKVVGSIKQRKPEVRYVYTVNGHRHTGNRIMIGPGPRNGGLGIPSAREYIRRYPKGRGVTVYFNPENPAESVLEPGMNRVVMLLLLVGMFFLLLGLFMLRRVLRRDSEKSDLAGKYPAGHLSEQNSRQEGRAGAMSPDPTGRLLGFLVLVFFFGIIGYIFWPECRLLLERHGIVRPLEATRKLAEPTSPGSMPPSRKPVAKDTAAPATPKAGDRKILKGDEQGKSVTGKVERIQVPIATDFVPVGNASLGSWKPFTTPLSDVRPTGVVQEPHDQGESRRYGSLMLGTGKNKTYHFVFDRIDDPHPLLYFDKNGNGDLTDDGGPLQNQGSGRFAAEIVLPIRKLIAELETDDDFNIWFFVNDRSWSKGFANHYSRTQMKGQLSINNRKYSAYIAEQMVHDANFTNDGIYIDLDANGKIDPKNEYVQHHQTIRIDGKAYLFDIGW
jgi:Protein of unknown function (DUF3592)